MIASFGWEDGVCDQEEEARRDEEGAEYGDPRRCPRHPGVATSSPDGMFDAPCHICEGEGDEEYRLASDTTPPDPQWLAEMADTMLPTIPAPAPVAIEDDGIPF